MLLAGIQKKTRMPAFAHARQLKGSVRDLAGLLELKLNHEEHEVTKSTKEVKSWNSMNCRTE